MKKAIRIITLTAFFLSILCSCDIGKSTENSNLANKFEYENTKGEDLSLISVDDDILYTVRYNEIGNAIVCSYDESGLKRH